MSYHPSGITIEIVGTEVSSNGRTCGAHDVCGSVLCDDAVVRLRMVQILTTEGAEETAIAAYLRYILRIGPGTGPMVNRGGNV
jgi:hypothetical protein